MVISKPRPLPATLRYMGISGYVGLLLLEREMVVILFPFALNFLTTTHEVCLRRALLLDDFLVYLYAMAVQEVCLLE